MNLVASVMCRNELGRFLPLAVSHLLSFCDSIAVLDDASDDGSADWLAKQDRVSLLRRDEPGFFEHEGRTRQELYDFTVAQNPTHVLSIDCDEFIGDPLKVRQACSRGDIVFQLGLAEVWKADVNNLYLRIDGHWKERRVPILFRPKRGYTIRDRKLACGREPQEIVKLAGRAREVGTTVYHMGWLDERARAARYARYAEHDKGNYHARAHLQSIMFPDRKVRMATEPWPPALESIREEILEKTGSVPSTP